ncbi:iron chelate uptake ABC transporter family permease subunit [Corynebacterium sp. CCM 8864]|uniref:Iron chelate uptake ABC transporter family permease subunit n=2 Tax=Corynebacterium marambiense TaxID=2765364 RepID=A0ABS0VSV7_9CORY|nr:iron chelate uptake ABC transporter family permease subunit [Corynebacterium marambiense]MBI8999844.1 iron chelate uptake ABC transporter family permease subunit [Corynebacterium marambiense]
MATCIVIVFALMLGDYPISATQVIRSLLGINDDPLTQFFVRDLRAPRVVMALIVGAALGISGAIFQALTGNPLGSPDITGFTVGAATGALLQIIVFNGGPLAIGLGALLGGFATGATVYLLSRQGGVTGTRFVLIGIGVAAILQGVNGLLIVRASLTAAQTAAQWLAGSFNATTWGETIVLGAVLALLIPASLLLARPLGVMLTGPDLAVGLGVPVDTRRIQLIIIGVSLVAVTVAAAGPIAFIALAAPQLARRLTRTSGPGLGGAALMGAFLVLTSDVISQRLFAPTQLPVGVVTGSLGGIYLIWLLSREWRKDRT